MLLLPYWRIADYICGAMQSVERNGRGCELRSRDEGGGGGADLYVKSRGMVWRAVLDPI
jgi:hypothetical protein